MSNNNLLKILTFKDLFFIGLCDIIGSGIFYIFIYTLLYGKRLSILGVILIGISSIISGLCYGEIISIFKNNSAEFNLISSIFGNNYSKIFSIIIIFFQLFTIATIIIALSKYLFNDSIYSLYFGILITIITFILLYFDIKLSSNIINSIGVIILIILIFIIIIGLFNITPSKNAFINKSPTYFNFLICCTFIVFLYSGYDSITKVYEEVHPDHIKYIPHAIISSIIVAGFLYLFLTIIMLYNFNNNKIKNINAPISLLYKLFIGDYAYYISFIIGAIILFGCAFDTSLISSRYIYGLSENNILPKNLMTLSLYKTPYIILILQFIFIFLIVLLHNVQFSLDMTNIFIFIILLHINLGIVIYRYNNQKNNDNFKMPFYYNNIPILPLFNSILIIILLIISIIILPNIVIST